MALGTGTTRLGSSHGRAMDLAKELYMQQRTLLQAFHNWKASYYNDFATAEEKAKTDAERWGAWCGLVCAEFATHATNRTAAMPV